MVEWSNLLQKYYACVGRRDAYVHAREWIYVSVHDARECTSMNIHIYILQNIYIYIYRHTRNERCTLTRWTTILNEGPGWRALTSGFWHPATPETGPSFPFLLFFFFFLFFFVLFSLHRVHACILVTRRPRERTRTRGQTNAINYLHLEMLKNPLFRRILTNRIAVLPFVRRRVQSGTPCAVACVRKTREKNLFETLIRTRPSNHVHTRVPRVNAATISS